MLNMKRTLHWIGEVNQETLSDICIELKEIFNESSKQNKHEYINLIITSSGGSTQIAFAFYDLIKTLYLPKRLRLRTIATGETDSAAIILFLAGKQRLITEHTTMLLHRVEQNIEGSPKKLFQAHKELRKTENQYAGIVARNTNLTKKQAIDKMIKETTLFSNDALKFGFAQELLKESTNSLITKNSS